MRLGQELSNWAILKICNTSFVAGVTPLHHINLRYTPPCTMHKFMDATTLTEVVEKGISDSMQS